MPSDSNQRREPPSGRAARPRAISESPLRTRRPHLFALYNLPSARGRIFTGDALAFLRTLGDASASIVFLDPPFNLGKDYGPSRQPLLDRRSDGEYRCWVESILIESARILKVGGALYLYHIPIWALRFANTLESVLTFRHWIAISMKNGFARGIRLYPAHYALLFFTKGKAAHLSRPKISPTLCRHCKRHIKDYGGYAKIIGAKGINLSDVWEDISPLRHRSTKHRRANELPPKITERIIAISGTPGGLYVDPFAGTGSGVLSAMQAAMTFEACDIVTSNCKIIAKRIDAHLKDQHDA